MVSEDKRLRRVARQHLETSRLLGLDFAPVAALAPPAETAAATGADPQATAAAGVASVATLFGSAPGGVPEVPELGSEAIMPTSGIPRSPR